MKKPLVGLWRSVWGGVLVAVLSLVTACGGGGGGGDEDIVLPNGVSIQGEIEAGGSGAVNVRLDEGNMVRLYIGLANSTDTPQTVVIPACFTFLDPSERNQNGLNVWRREIVVPPMKTIRVLLGTYCMNSDRSIPTGGVTYQLGGVTPSDDLRRLCEILRERVLTRNSDVQSLVWKITSGGRLSEEDWSLLNELTQGEANPRTQNNTVPDKAEWLRLFRAQAAATSG